MAGNCSRPSWFTRKFGRGIESGAALSVAVIVKSPMSAVNCESFCDLLKMLGLSHAALPFTGQQPESGTQKLFSDGRTESFGSCYAKRIAVGYVKDTKYLWMFAES